MTNAGANMTDEAIVVQPRSTNVHALKSACPCSGKYFYKLLRRSIREFVSSLSSPSFKVRHSPQNAALSLAPQFDRER